MYIHIMHIIEVGMQVRLQPQLACSLLSLLLRVQSMDLHAKHQNGLCKPTQFYMHVTKVGLQMGVQLPWALILFTFAGRVQSMYAHVSHQNGACKPAKACSSGRKYHVEL